MAEFYRMPKVGTGKSAVTITRWNVEEGQSVLPGDMLFEAEAGKMGASAKAEASTLVRRILVREGEKAACGAPVAICAQAEEDISPLEAAYLAEKEAEQAASPTVRIGIIGAGPGGYVAAIRAAQLGAAVTIIEKKKLGGTCLNEGCIPTKAMLHSALLYHEAKTGRKCGIACDPTVDFPQVVAYKQSVSDRLIQGIDALLRAGSIRVVQGQASFADAHTVRVESSGGVQTLEFDKIIIATGSYGVKAPIPGAELPCCIDSRQALSLESLPRSMTIVGGGVIGMEMAAVYANLGTAVTVVEMFPTLLGSADQELVAMAQAEMEQLGVRFFKGARVHEIRQDNAGAVTAVDTVEGIQEISSELVLLCTGRRANIASLALENAGVHCEGGKIKTDAYLRTNVQDIYAVGDCTSSIMLAHVASAQAEAAAENAMGGRKLFSEKTAPNCVYMCPELASVGLTEDEAKTQGVACTVGRFQLSANGKAIIENNGRGMVKIVAEATFQRVIGMQILGPHAAELIMEGALAIKMGAKVQDLIDTIHGHPSVAEAIHEAALAVQGRAIHA